MKWTIEMSNKELTRKAKLDRAVKKGAGRRKAGNEWRGGEL